MQACIFIHRFQFADAWITDCYTTENVLVRLKTNPHNTGPTTNMEIHGSLFQHNQMSCWMPGCHAPIPQPNSHHLLFLNIQKPYAKEFKNTGLSFLKYCLQQETDNLPALRLKMLSVKKTDDAYLASKKSGMFEHSMMAST